MSRESFYSEKFSLRLIWLMSWKLHVQTLFILDEVLCALFNCDEQNGVMGICIFFLCTLYFFCNGEVNCFAIIIKLVPWS
jgi:hypothetical protein